ncbi:MAG: RNA polymerase sigma factor RpoD/SigA [Planctomycetia bacterium]|nr:RNA polymerase sigma factor RpoD/SigA [Planctomycetia bacterium]
MKSKRREKRERMALMGSGLDIYLKEINNIPLLTAEEETELAQRIALDDKEALNILVQSNLRLVVNIAREYLGKGLQLSDLIEEGNMGLIRAAQGFSVDPGTRFSTYASYWIRQAIRRALINSSKMIRLPAYMVEIIGRWYRTADRLEEDLSRQPLSEEIGRRMGLPPAQLPAILQALGLHTLVPPSENPDGGWEGVVIDDRERTPDEAYLKKDTLAIIQEELQKLPPKEAMVLILRFGLEGHEEHTLREVGEKLNLTRERVRQISQKALHKIGAKLQ